MDQSALRRDQSMVVLDRPVARAGVLRPGWPLREPLNQGQLSVVEEKASHGTKRNRAANKKEKKGGRLQTFILKRQLQLGGHWMPLISLAPKWTPLSFKPLECKSLHHQEYDDFERVTCPPQP